MSTFAPDNFPDCKANLFIATPCQPRPKRRGTVKFEKTDTHFADNGLGNGAGVKITCQLDGITTLDEWVTLTWIDWNEFEYESVL